MLMSEVNYPKSEFVPTMEAPEAPSSGFTQPDYTDMYNTALTDSEEAEFQSWAKENNRLNDLYDYDMRGAWKEGAQAGSDGHFTDKYKKPNHPTFSNQSIYSSKDLMGGEWTEKDGKQTFRPARSMSESEAKYLQKYFSEREPGVNLDLSGLVRSDEFMRKQFVASVFANPNEASLFEGATGIWRAIPSAFLSTTSAVVDVLSSIPLDSLATTKEGKEWLSGQRKTMEQNAQSIREYNEANYGINSYRAGAATQVLHGLVETLPKAALYASGLGLAGGAVTFGAELGINRMQGLKAQGVDENTAAWAGVTSFAAGAIGLRLPPALGLNRITSAIYGGLSNAAVVGAELGAINWVLKNQNYNDLADSYKLNVTDMLVASGLGAMMGAGFWRKPVTVAEMRNNVYIQHRAELTKQWTTELLGVKNEDGTQKFTQEEAETQARAGANAVASYCNQYGLTPEQFWSRRPQVSFDENGKISIEIPKNPLEGIDTSARGYTQAQKSFERINNIRNDSNLSAEDKAFQLADELAILDSNYSKMTEEDALRPVLARQIEEIKAELQKDGYEFVDLVGKDYNQGMKVQIDQVVEDPTLPPGSQVITGQLKPMVLKDGVMVRTGKVTVSQNMTPEAMEILQRNVTNQQERATQREDLKKLATEEQLATHDRLTRNAESRKQYLTQGEEGEYFSRKVTESSKPKSFNDYIENGIYHVDQRALSIKKEQGRSYSTLNKQETKAFNDFIDSVPKTEANRIKKNLSKFQNTPWGAQALEAVFVRQAIKALQEGRIPDFQSVLDNPDASGFRRAIISGDDGIKRYLEKSNIIGHPSKVEEAINASFLNCDPSLACAEFCYASDSILYKGKNSVIKSELIDMMVKRYPDWAAKQISREYPDFLKQTKALRLFDKGDGDIQWMPFIKALNNEGIRVAIFSKKPDFLRLVDEKNVRLLSIDDTNMKLFEKNKDLPIAFVYQSEKSLKNLLKVIKTGRIGVILPVQLGKGKAAKELNAKNVSQLISELKKDPETESAAKRICAFDSGRAPDGWTCRHCDNKGGAGCYLGQTTEKVIQFFNPRKKVSLENVISEVELLKELLDNEQQGIATTNEQLGNLGILRRKSTQGNSNAKAGASINGAVQLGNTERLARIRSVLSEDLRYLKDRLDAIAEIADVDYGSGAHQGSGRVSQGDVRGQESVQSGTSERGQGSQRAGEQSGDSYSQRIGDNLYGGKYSAKKNSVSLTPYANLSTFSHEMGHWYLEQTFDLFASGHQNELLKQDTEILMKALGIKSIDEWNAMSPEAKTKAHETFADWVEQYLSTGKVPDSSMAGVMKRIADWIVGVYQSALGKDVQKTASDAIAERHEAQFGEKLPPLSEEVKSILDRLYKDQLEPKHRPTNEQTAAARAVLAMRANQAKANAFADGTASDKNRYDTLVAALKAQGIAIEKILNGEKVELSEQVSEMSLDEGAVQTATDNFGKAFVLGDSDTSSIVVLQNRKRSESFASDVQINQIAADPQYGLASVSRSTQQGAPLVSFGKLPETQYLGKQDYVVDNGERIPVQYAVMESRDLQTSNFINGIDNPRYGQSIDDTQVVAGNGRVIGLTDSYRRGTGKKYQQEMADDFESHGVSPDVIKAMEQPILVRIMPPEKVTTDFVKRSNQEQVMATDVLEKAKQDAPLIRKNIGKYEFGENGEATAETVRRFLQDIDEINNLKQYLTDDGRPKESISNRISAAVFHAAYQNDSLTKLFDDPDVNIKRVLRAMTALAPRILELRAATHGNIDLAQAFVDAANAVKTARAEGTIGVDVSDQLSLFGDQSALPFSSVFTQYANSEGALLRIFKPLLDWTQKNVQAAQDPTFPIPMIDLADVAAQLRTIQNGLRAEKGLQQLPNINAEEIRGTLEATKKIIDTAQQESAPPAKVVEAQREHAQRALQTQDEFTLEFNDMLAQNPDTVIDMGDGVRKSVREIQQDIDSIQNEANANSLAMGEAVVCILKNKGI